MPQTTTKSTVTAADLEDLRVAKELVENPGIAARITDYIGSPIEYGFSKLPKSWKDKLGEVTRESLLKAADAAIFTLNNAPGKKASNFWHKLGVAASGSVGGFFGLTGLAVELPVSTTIMLRSIADIARSQGEDIDEVDTRLACLEVFALGGKSSDDDAVDTGYYSTRAFLAKSMTEAAKYIAEKGFVEEGAPVILRFFVKVAERFGFQVAEKVSAQTIPILGAAGGAIINSLFMDHFQDMARGHFIIRRLERLYGKDTIQTLYQTID